MENRSDEFSQKLLNEMNALYSLLLLFFYLITQIIAIYVNFCLVVMVFRTIKDEYKYPYYPLLFLIMFSNVLFVAMTTAIAVLGGLSRIVPALAKSFPVLIMIAISYPTVICVLDFLLCIHRFSVMFWDSEFWSIHVRWKGPLIFLITLPFVVLISSISITYSSLLVGVEIDAFGVGNLPLYCFISDIALKSLLGFLTFVGYVLILLRVAQQNRKVGKFTDFTVIEQAFPIACFQLISSILTVFMHMGVHRSAWSFAKVCLLKYAFTQLLCIVVPISIIIGNQNRRKKFRYFCVCLKPNQVEPANHRVCITMSNNRTSTTETSF
ncbi:unnamed protein product [Caenorhabditis bovis]|uniref:Uncharacterized protein n=1 Tax=Caenorhabditis bovis TaxID=2654633 RepID=A0A8S1EDR8_9PELO|nr:unnamed protein product [Caenorhabditis bovis]